MPLIFYRLLDVLAYSHALPRFSPVVIIVAAPEFPGQASNWPKSPQPVPSLGATVHISHTILVFPSQLAATTLLAFDWLVYPRPSIPPLLEVTLSDSALTMRPQSEFLSPSPADQLGLQPAA
ncbi:unnamed protein product [Protopolystoma xenopodis]|uniref:Uncharacterized protein n=1 Tax=Protopolystoma xenopodis TaxID=117903 RepID=A0A3S5BQQ1_9PLAT|nr:unnamed protein product [Protopolystoma xenopodis]